MTTEHLRCPACDSAFSEGEAVLRCSVCKSLHHPRCWIDGGSCAAQPKHDSFPEPVAFHIPEPVLEAIPAPPKSTKVRGPASEQPLIGGSVRTVPVGPRPAASKGAPPLENPPNPGQLGGRTQRLPTIYTGPGILRFWYLPVGALLASAVAFGVIWGVDYLSKDDTPAVVVAPTATPTDEPTMTPTPAESTGTPESTTTPLPTVISSAFEAGNTAFVGGTGGDCLNVRAAAGINAAAVDCIDDGTEVTIVGGPLAADSFVWWQIQAPNATGWAVEIYLSQP